jgi:uncharacterized protein
VSSISNLDDFRALEPFFRVIEQALVGLVDGEHFFDLLADEVVFDYIITVPNYPRHVVGRAAVAELYRRRVSTLSRAGPSHSRALQRATDFNTA